MIFGNHVHKVRGNSSRAQLDRYVLGLTLSGEAIHQFDSDPVTLTAGDVQLIRPGTRQHWAVRQKWETVYCVFEPRPHWRAWLRYPWEAGMHIQSMKDAPAWPRMVDRMMDIAQWHRSAYDHRVELQLSAVEEVLLWCHAHHRAQSHGRDERVTAAVEYIAAHLAEPISVDDIADAVGLSRSRLTTLFTAQLDISLMQYVEQQRMERARQLLRYSDESVANVARDVGYQDPKYFSKRFYAATGLTPRAWRHQRGV